MKFERFKLLTLSLLTTLGLCGSLNAAYLGWWKNANGFEKNKTSERTQSGQNLSETKTSSARRSYAS
jgi:hypothetical protein